MGMFDRLFGSASSTPEVSDPLAEETAAVRTLIGEAITNARTAALAEGRQPNLSDYMEAANDLSGRAEQQGLAWGPRVFADLSGQRLEGFVIRQEDLYPSQEQKDLMKDVLDLDNDQAINDFYAAFQTQFSLNNAVLEGVTFKPATTFDANRAEGARFNNVTFDGMGADDQIVLGQGQYTNIHFININHGQIVVSDGANIRGLDLQGQTASLEIGRAQITGLEAEGSTIVSLTATPGARITQANFNGATIEEASRLQGTVWDNGTFHGTDLRGVDFQGARLTNVQFVNCEVENLSFRGASLSNVSFTNMDLSGIDFTGVRITGPVFVNGVQISSERDLTAMRAAEDARAVLTPAAASVAKSAEPLNARDLGQSLYQFGKEFNEISLNQQQAAGPAGPTKGPSNDGPAMSF